MWRELEKNDIYVNAVDAIVTYTGSKYFSVIFERDWYIGNTNEEKSVKGYVYDLDTGKAVSLSKIT